MHSMFIFWKFTKFRELTRRKQKRRCLLPSNLLPLQAELPFEAWNLVHGVPLSLPGPQAGSRSDFPLSSHLPLPTSAKEPPGEGPARAQGEQCWERGRERCRVDNRPTSSARLRGESAPDTPLCLFEWKNEGRLLLTEITSGCRLCDDERWLWNTEYIVHISHKLNDLNFQLQWFKQNI